LVPSHAEATCHGAVTIVNAMATGKGAAVGVTLWTKARVTLTADQGLIVARNLTHLEESTKLVEETVRSVFRRFGLGRRFGAIVETESNIPVAVGLKSSSAASTAVSLACVKALRKRLTNIEVIKLGVKASLRTGVTFTGAYDDACACYFGGIVVTDNLKMKLLKRFIPKDRISVLIHVPRKKVYTRDVDRVQIKTAKPIVSVAHKEALRGNYWNALTLNGLAYSNAFSYGAEATIEALGAGAIAAGLTGKGPAVAAIVSQSKTQLVRAAWRPLKGRILETKLNLEQATARSLH